MLDEKRSTETFDHVVTKNAGSTFAIRLAVQEIFDLIARDKRNNRETSKASIETIVHKMIYELIEEGAIKRKNEVSALEIEEESDVEIDVWSANKVFDFLSDNSVNKIPLDLANKLYNVILKENF
jgi:hypothetical protein